MARGKAGTAEALPAAPGLALVPGGFGVDLGVGCGLGVSADNRERLFALRFALGRLWRFAQRHPMSCTRRSGPCPRLPAVPARFADKIRSYAAPPVALPCRRAPCVKAMA